MYDNYEEFFIEAELNESVDYIIHEAIAFRLVKKDYIPDSFKKTAIEVVDEFEKGAGKIKLGSGYLGIRTKNIKDKIEKKDIKSCYTINIPYKAALNGLGVKPKWYDNLAYDPSIIAKFCFDVFRKCGFKPIGTSIGSNDGMFIKKQDGCIFNVQAIGNGDGTATVYIRCLVDSPENIELLSGGKRFVKEQGIFAECTFI